MKFKGMKLGKISVSEFLSSIKYKPKFIGKDLDGCVLVQFREFKNFSPSLEFGTVICDKKTNGQDLYFEILDLRGYREGDIIPLDSNMRKFVIHGIATKENIHGFSEHINKSLHELYSGRVV